VTDPFPPTDPTTPNQPMTAAPAGSTASGSSATRTNIEANVEQASVMTEELIDRGAPWSTQTTPTIVIVEAVVAGILGLMFLFKPLGGSSTTLQLAGVVLLVGALITAFQLWRGKVRPDLERLYAFRAGSGITVGLVIVVATFFAAVTEAVTAALAVIVGIGFIIFGLAGIGASFVRRTHDSPLPMATLILNAILAISGLILMFSGAAGSAQVDTIFNLLGIALVVTGLGLAGYAYLLRQQEAEGVRR
jgi:uncharacterized membrane protein HdeD (DUF308 family)